MQSARKAGPFIGSTTTASGARQSVHCRSGLSGG